ncbi:hypothetical protein V2J09_022829 [Rumex salicifolius]
MEIPLFPFLVFCLLSAEAAATTSYFIHCGADSNTTDQDQVFTGDSSLPAGVEVKAKGSSTSVTSSSNSNNSLYTTARAFSSDSSYQFDTSDGAGTYLLRLHFFAFSDTLASARFSVSSNGHTLLPNFTGSEASNSPVLKEFLVPVDTGDETLRLYFIPIGSSGSAFVNAIEVIFAALNLTDVDSPITVTPSGGYNGSFGQLGSRVLVPVYRLNVGGSNVSASGDILRRSWWKDDSYLVAGKQNTTAIGPSSSVNWSQGNSTGTDAPFDVYNTARGWNKSVDSSSSSSSAIIRNASWSFSASKQTSYLVRVHFCDIVSIAEGEIAFNLYFFSKFAWEVYPHNITEQGSRSTPFCLDFVVTSDEVGFINLTIGSVQEFGGAFLNGLEIMKFVNGSTKEPSIPSRKHTNVVLIACVVAGGFALIVTLVAASVWLLRRNRKGAAEPVEDFDWPLAILNASSESKTTTTASDNTTSLSSLPSLHLRIPIGVIKQVTKNFDEALVIGQGGFGKVYKGVLKNGLKVAVKRSDSKHGQGLPEFQTEITVLSRIRHRHLVSLIGYCDDGDEMILVYEYMEKGTLREHLYGASDHQSFQPMSWKQRLEICIGAANGLHYLHTGSTGGIIHRDVKSTNILLDHKLVAKVADFGLSRSGALEQDTHVSTVVKGTFGYLDPEYYQLMQLTDKSDVYSFGVLLLEVLCARLVLDTSLPQDQVNLADWAMSCHHKGELERVIDPSLAGQINPNSLAKFVETAKNCLKDSGIDRPQMSDVIWDLEYTLQLHKFGAGGGGDSTITGTQMSFNLPMLDVMGSSSTAFPMQLEEEDDEEEDEVDVGDSNLVSMAHSMPNGSV